MPYAIKSMAVFARMDRVVLSVPFGSMLENGASAACPDASQSMIPDLVPRVLRADAASATMVRFRPSGKNGTHGDPLRQRFRWV